MRRFIPTFDEDLPTLFLLLLLMIIPAAGMAAAGWVSGITILYLVVIASLFFGYLLSVSKFSDVAAIATATVYGFFITWVVGGQTIRGNVEWQARQLQVITRLVKWAEQAAGGGFSRDNMMFLMMLALIFWFLGINATLNTFRSRQLWIAIIPPGLALLINTYYYYGNSRMDLFLIAYLFLVFILAVRTNTLLRERLWKQARVGYSAGVRGDLLRGGMIGAVVLVIVAWSAPAASASNQLASAWDRSINPWNRVQDTFNRLFSGVEGSGGSTADYYGGSTLALGGPVSLTDATVMYVYAPPGYRYYWRSKLFDYYDGRRWLTLADERKDSDYGVLPGEEEEGYALRVNVQQQFQMVGPATRLIYAAPQVISVASMPVSFDEIYTQPPSKHYGTVVSIRGRNVIGPGRSYSVTSSLSVADQSSLRTAGDLYPDWVEQRYLQLPGEVTQRTRDLAASITGSANNPYDKARAIEAYLRANIKYDINIDPPPGNAEPVDYFLFTSQRGYCNYYASAMVIMLRSQGIPARMSAGFAQGDFDNVVNGFRVKELNAHTWVEAYFPKYGWIDFEPTTAISPIIRAEAPIAGGQVPNTNPRSTTPTEEATEDLSRGVGFDPDGQHNDVETQTGLNISIPPIVGWLFALVVLAGLSAFGVWFWLEMRGMQGLSEVSRSYARMNQFATLSGVLLKDGATPTERGDQIAASIPNGRELIQRIAAYYAHEQYAPPGARPRHGDQRSQVASSDWQTLRPMMVRELVNRFLGRFRLRIRRR